MIFIASVKGWDVPREILDEAVKIPGINVLYDKNYFYLDGSFKTEDPDGIGDCINSVLGFVEANSGIFEKAVLACGDIELYITHLTRKTAGFVLDSMTVKRLASLGMSVGID